MIGDVPVQVKGAPDRTAGPRVFDIISVSMARSLRILAVSVPRGAGVEVLKR